MKVRYLAIALLENVEILCLWPCMYIIHLQHEESKKNGSTKSIVVTLGMIFLLNKLEAWQVPQVDATSWLFCKFAGIYGSVVLDVQNN